MSNNPSITKFFFSDVPAALAQYREFITENTNTPAQIDHLTSSFSLTI